MADDPGRKAPVRLPVRERDNRSAIVFLTVCTKGRRSILADPKVHETLLH
jgi:hypothetical protein